jgi:hypothetical protein
VFFFIFMIGFLLENEYNTDQFAAHQKIPEHWGALPCTPSPW